MQYFQKRFLTTGVTVDCFRENVPGNDWVRGFVARNKMTLRAASNIKRARAGVSREDICQFFDNYEAALEKYGD